MVRPSDFGSECRWFESSQDNQKQKRMRKLLCKIFGHRVKYNFTYMPSKAICERCHKKWIATGSLMNIWKEVEAFENDKRTDKELINKWCYAKDY